MTYPEQRDRILQNLRDLFTRLSKETDETKRTQLETKCHEQLDLLDTLRDNDKEETV